MQTLSFVWTRQFLALVLPALVLVAGLYGTAIAQTTTPDQSRKIGPGGVVLGDSCQRRTDRIEGIVKIDACGRWYCGRIDINDITVLNPNIAEEMGCKWQIVDTKCKCIRPR